MAKKKAQPKAAAGEDSTANLGFEAKLWLAADKLRNNMDAAEYIRAPGALLSSQVRGFCDFARSIGKKLGASDEIYDLLGIGCFGEGEARVTDVIGILPTERRVENDARATLFFIMAAVSIPGVFLVGYRVLNRDRRSARDTLFAEWEDLLPHLGELPSLTG